MPLLIAFLVLALLAPGATAQLPFRLAQPEPRPTLTQLITVGDHDAAPPPIIVLPTDSTCSGRISGPGGSFLALPAIDTDTYAGLPGTNEGSILLLDACFASLAEIMFENRDPGATGGFIVGPVTVRVRVEALGNVFEFDLLSNGSFNMQGVPAYDGVTDFGGSSGTFFLTPIRGTFAQAAFQAQGVDPSQPFPVRTTLTINPVFGQLSSPVTFSLDVFGRGGVSFSVLAP